MSEAAGEWTLPSDVDAIRDALVEWYEHDHREFPWRETDDPYAILVSEVMSQQTQLARVEDAWHAFLDRWPTTAALAAADRADVVGFWSSHSLGYNNRAKYLHEAANQVEDGEVGPTNRPPGDGDSAARSAADHSSGQSPREEAVEGDGEFPESPDELAELMGVGPYTANAVASFAFNNGDAVVDTNVKRVLYRAFDVEDSDDAFETAAQVLMPDGESRVWNNAIMELGGVACEKTPKCDTAECPWREWCHAYKTGDFTAPDVPTQPDFEGSRRQMRGRVLSTLKEYDHLPLDHLGPRIRVDYTPEGDYGREWLTELLTDLADDGLITVEERNGETVARLRR